MMTLKLSFYTLGNPIAKVPSGSSHHKLKLKIQFLKSNNLIDQVMSSMSQASLKLDRSHGIKPRVEATELP